MQKFSKAQERKKRVQIVCLSFTSKKDTIVYALQFSVISEYAQATLGETPQNRFLFPSDSFQSYVNRNIKKKDKVSIVLFYVK